MLLLFCLMAFGHRQEAAIWSQILKNYWSSHKNIRKTRVVVHLLRRRIFHTNSFAESGLNKNPKVADQDHKVHMAAPTLSYCVTPCHCHLIFKFFSFNVASRFVNTWHIINLSYLSLNRLIDFLKFLERILKLSNGTSIYR